MTNTTLIRSNSSAFTSFKKNSKESVDTQESVDIEDKNQYTPHQTLHPIKQVQRTRTIAFQNIRKMFQNLPTLSCATK